MKIRLVKEAGKKVKTDTPLIHAGIDPPVRNPMQSFVKELQLKSTQDEYHERAAYTHLRADSHTQDMILHEYKA